jgi:cysteine-rich repeat protein
MFSKITSYTVAVLLPRTMLTVVLRPMVLREPATVDLVIVVGKLAEEVDTPALRMALNAPMPRASPPSNDPRRIVALHSRMALKAPMLSVSAPPPVSEARRLILGLAVDEACGDGSKASSEACDDGNTVTGDGCSAGCIIEEDECRIAGE